MSMRKSYVIVFAYTDDEFVIVEKDRPEWQRGRKNLIGGSIEDGEKIIEAAIREMKEETGLTPSGKPEILGTIQANFDESGVIVWAVSIPVEKKRIRPRSGETELPEWTDMGVLEDIKLLPNLKIIIPLMKCGVRGWTVNMGANDNLFLISLD